ncbi:hypothetical protein Srufu_013310 [Streptomyces libani subsp. rufus]|nr:hypothetical protein Srufu_013310 [Streptomyces libani subsp. rufus]
MLRRRRDRSGTWWYDLQIELPDRVEDRRHGPSLTYRTITFSAPFPDVQGLPGVNYASLDLPPAREAQAMAPLPVTAPGQLGRGLPPPSRLRSGAVDGRDGE